MAKSVDKSIAEAVNEIESAGKTANDPNEKVVLEIPLSETQQDDWFCCVNGKTFQVQRGEKVMVPKYVKEVYDNEKRMTELSIKRSQALQRKAAEKEKLAFS